MMKSAFASNAVTKAHTIAMTIILKTLIYTVVEKGMGHRGEQG